LLAILASCVLVAAVPWVKDAGQGLLADWLAQRARKKFIAGDMPGTVADSTRAFSLLGEEVEDSKAADLLLLRGIAKLRLNDLNGSLADLNRAIGSPNTRRGLREECYFHRSWVHCRLKNFGEAVNDATEVIQLAGDHHPNLAMLLNQRAYIRALANAGKDELEAGLKDIERALAMTRENAAYIDTRGYLLHLLGRNDEALRDMNRAIDLTGAVRLYRANEADRLREDLAVMCYHRGLVYDALGMKDKAIEDFQMADELGYNPEAGVL
jgi:tetratricopeptide (TPR) repeat protein